MRRGLPPMGRLRRTRHVVAPDFAWRVDRSGGLPAVRFYRIHRGARKMEATTCDQTVRPAVAEMISTLAHRMGTSGTAEGLRRRGSLGGSANWVRAWTGTPFLHRLWSREPQPRLTHRR